jgi:hypothetical protein
MAMELLATGCLDPDVLSDAQGRHHPLGLNRIRRLIMNPIDEPLCQPQVRNLIVSDLPMGLSIA